MLPTDPLRPGPEDGETMKVLKRALYLQAAAWAAFGVLEIALPRWLLESVFRQPAQPDLAWVRTVGAMAIGLALMMVLVANRASEVWWWAWAFAAVNAVLATVAGMNALFGPPDGSALALWWLFFGGNVGFGAATLMGIARSAQEKPIA